MPLFESYSRRIDQITPVLAKYGISSCEEAEKVCLDKGIDVRAIVRGIQNIAFENAGWAYTVGAAIAIKKGCTRAADAAAAIGEGKGEVLFEHVEMTLTHQYACLTYNVNSPFP